jgi:hypothetical protein
MIVSLEGPMGSGKTCTATALAYTEYIKNGKKVLANYHMNFPFQYMDHNYWLAHLQDDVLQNCVIVLDEGYLESDSRLGMGRMQRLWTYFYAQTRKRDVVMYIPMLHIDEVDKRLRRKVDIRGTVTPNEQLPCRNCVGLKESDPRYGSGKVKMGKGYCSTCGGQGKILSTKEVVCLQCQGTGMTQIEKIEGVKEDISCMKCEGKGKLVVGGDEAAIVCPTCAGTGKGDVCPKCLGYGKTGTYTTRFVDFRRTQSWYGRKRIKTIKVIGPAFWPLYDTLELVPFTAKQMRIPIEDI